jgi:capsular polysaccharide export protein
LALLKAVRHRCPDAFIVYKPHPDVQADLRVGRLSSIQLEGLSDAVIERLDMPSCLANADEVHTLTSLTGFEALLRGVAVTCYGMPFYAGWGLTTDVMECERRSQPISLETLVYGALIACPMYMIPDREGFATVEQVIHEIQLTKHHPQQSHWSVGRWLLAGIARIRAFFLM